MAAVIERQNVTVQPTGAALAADIAGVDLAGALSRGTVAAVKAAWAEHLVLRFRGQREQPCPLHNPGEKPKT